MKRIGNAVVCLFFSALGCAPADGLDPATGEVVGVAQSSLTADDLYAQLRQLEIILPPPPAQATIDMGSWTPGGNFVGLTKSCQVVFNPIKHLQCVPPTATINAISALLRFYVPIGVIVTANGRSAVSDYSGVVVIDVGDASQVSWSVQSGSYGYSDSLRIARPDVGGVGAFTIAALPLTIVYEPPQNAAHSNSASTSFATESTVVNTITSGNSTTSQPEWAEGLVAKQIGIKLAMRFPQTAVAYQVLQGIITLWGSVDTTVTSNSEVTTEKSLSVKITTNQAITTTAHLGPGHGDLIVFYKDARVAWGMDAGKVSLTLIDHGPLVILTADTLKADLAAVNAGGVAPVSGLDADSLASLISIDPMAANSKRSILSSIFGGVTLPASRFTKDLTLLVNGASYTQNVSHAVTESDKVSTTTSTTTVNDYHPGWLTLLGIGQTQAGKMTTKLTYGASRTTTSTQTKTSSLSLSAAATESYTVDVNYDNIFGTFLVRTPPTPPIIVNVGTLARAQ